MDFKKLLVLAVIVDFSTPVLATQPTIWEDPTTSHRNSLEASNLPYLGDSFSDHKPYISVINKSLLLSSLNLTNMCL